MTYMLYAECVGIFLFCFRSSKEASPHSTWHLTTHISYYQHAFDFVGQRYWKYNLRTVLWIKWQDVIFTIIISNVSNIDELLTLCITRLAMLLCYMVYMYCVWCGVSLICTLLRPYALERLIPWRIKSAATR